MPLLKWMQLRAPCLKLVTKFTIMTTLTRESASTGTTHGYTNSLMMPCHQLPDGRAKALEQNTDGIHQTNIPMSQPTAPMDLTPSTHQHWLSINTSIDTSTDIITKSIIKQEILETMESSRKSTALPQLINQCCHSHGEELNKPIQEMDSKTHPSNGLIVLLRKTSKISETKRLMKKYMDLLIATTAFTQLHIQEKNTQTTECSIHNSNISLPKWTLEIPSM